MHSLPTDIKIFFYTVAALICSAIAAIFEHYRVAFISNEKFIIILFGIWVMDIFLGAYKHWKKHDFNFKRLFTRALLKLSLSFAAMVLTNAFISLPQIVDTPPANWFMFTMQMLNLVWIAGSAWTSCYYISNQTFPPKAFMERMENFNKSLNVKDLTDNPNKNIENE